jgi:hypothetical protein
VCDFDWCNGALCMSARKKVSSVVPHKRRASPSGRILMKLGRLSELDEAIRSVSQNFANLNEGLQNSEGLKIDISNFKAK